jgi:hypothetical protein
MSGAETAHGAVSAIQEGRRKMEEYEKDSK